MIQLRPSVRRRDAVLLAALLMLALPAGIFTLTAVVQGPDVPAKTTLLSDISFQVSSSQPYTVTIPSTYTNQGFQAVITFQATDGTSRLQVVSPAGNIVASSTSAGQTTTLSVPLDVRGNYELEFSGITGTSVVQLSINLE